VDQPFHHSRHYGHQQRQMSMMMNPMNCKPSMR
jgi:hypothetical protein